MKTIKGLFMVMVMVMTLSINVEAKAVDYDELAMYYKTLVDKEIEEGIEEEFEDAVIDTSEITYTSSIDKIDEAVYKYKVILTFNDNGDVITISAFIDLYDCKTTVDVDNGMYDDGGEIFTFNGRRTTEDLIDSYFESVKTNY